MVRRGKYKDRKAQNAKRLPAVGRHRVWALNALRYPLCAMRYWEVFLAHLFVNSKAFRSVR